MKPNKLWLIIFVLALPLIAFALQIGVILPQNVVAFRGNQNVSVPIWLTNNDSVLAMEFQVNHSQYFIFRGVEATSRMSNATVEWNVKDVNSDVVAVLIPNSIAAGNGVIMNLLFDVNSSTPVGVYTVKMDDFLVVNLDDPVVELTLQDGLFTVI